MDSDKLFFADDSVDRRNDVRPDDSALANLQHADDARYLLISHGRVRAESGTPVRVAWRRAAELQREGVDLSTVAFLGMFQGCPRFAVIPNERPLTAHDRFQNMTDDHDFVGLRRAALTMGAPEAQMVGHAVHLSNWINRNRYCGTCGRPTQLREGGHKLQCRNTDCAREEFPRTDPVVITLVTHDERCLLARQPKFPPRFYSALAGFVEPGETLETAVRREVREEAGMEVQNLRYIGSQPWPFPTSLMTGFLAETASDAFKLDGVELEDARWFERSELRELTRLPPDTPDVVLLPPKGVMGRQLIEDWLARR